MSQPQEARPTHDPAPPAPAPALALKQKNTPAKERVDLLPPFRVLLHNDDVNEMGYVVETLVALTPLNPPHAARVMLEAHHRGVALVLVTHRERAELYVDQFRSKRLTASIERAE